MASLPDAVATIQAHAAPVVFLDTCVLLDIIRAPFRNKASTVQAARELLTAAQRVTPTVYPVIGYPTPTEWGDNVEKAIEDGDEAVRIMNAVAEAWGFLDMAGIPLLPELATILPVRLREISEILLNAAISLDKDHDALHRAFDRIINAALPAKKGGRGAGPAHLIFREFRGFQCVTVRFSDEFRV